MSLLNRLQTAMQDDPTLEDCLERCLSLKRDKKNIYYRQWNAEHKEERNARARELRTGKTKASEELRRLVDKLQKSGVKFDASTGTETQTMTGKPSEVLAKLIDQLKERMKRNPEMFNETQKEEMTEILKERKFMLPKSAPRQETGRLKPQQMGTAKRGSTYEDLYPELFDEEEDELMPGATLDTLKSGKRLKTADFSKMFSDEADIDRVMNYLESNGVPPPEGKTRRVHLMRALKRGKRLASERVEDSWWKAHGKKAISLFNELA